MKLKQIIQLVALILVGSVATAFASDVAVNTPGLSGYDPVAYFTDGKAVRGSGFSRHGAGRRDLRLRQRRTQDALQKEP